MFDWTKLPSAQKNGHALSTIPKVSIQYPGFFRALCASAVKGFSHE
jgi:hypothetical protein